MERVRLRRLKASSKTDGNRDTQKQRTVQKLATGSTSRISGVNEKKFTYELGQRSSKQVTGTPMKKLLAQEMSKETEAKRQSGSVIARLMGLDRAARQQPFQKKLNGLPQNYQQGSASTGLRQIDSPYERRSNNRKASMEQQGSKDMYEVSETLKVEEDQYPSKGVSSLKTTEETLIRKKIIETNRRCLNEDLQNSRDFCVTAERLNSKKKLFRRYLKQPDALFTKHILNLTEAGSKSECSHVTVMKPSNYEKYESNAIGWKMERDSSSKDENSSNCKRRDGCLTHTCHKHGVQCSHKSSKIQSDKEPEKEALPSKIVVLKPNLGKLQDSTTCSHADSSKHVDNPSKDVVLGGFSVNKKNYNFVGYSKPISKECREIAREVTRQMRETLGGDTINLPYVSGGYAGDESSYNMSGSDSASELDMTMLSSGNSFNRGNRLKVVSCHSVDSSVSREAKKRLSERWKMTQKYQEVHLVGRGSTLGEMLAIPDRVTRKEKVDFKTVVDESSDKFVSTDETAGLDIPLGISSRDGWKEGDKRSSQRRHSEIGCEGPKRTMQFEAYDDDLHLTPKDAINRVRKKTVKGKSRSSNKKSQSSCHTSKDNTDSLQEVSGSQFPKEVNNEKKDPVVSEVSTDYVTDRSLIVDVKAGADHESIILSSESSVELLSKLSVSVVDNVDSSTHGPEVSNAQDASVEPSEGSGIPLQGPIEPPSPASSKEADHQSPVSVLEVPFSEDVSTGSECFESVSAGLHELRMQLKLLKMESQGYEDGVVLVSSNEHPGQEYIAVSEEKGIFITKSCESSYLVDVLNDSGFNDGDLDMFMATWHSPECPLGPSLFNNLEKKYCDETTWLKSERRLLFDRINSALLEIFNRYVDPQPWVKQMMRKVGLKWQKDGVKNELFKLLVNKENTLDEDEGQLVLEAECEWMDLTDATDVIGKEIEKLLISDLITEVVAM